MRRHKDRGRGTPRRRLGALLAGLVSTLALAGCGSAGAPAVAEAETAPRADCLAPQVIAALGLGGEEVSGTAHPDAPERGAVPEGFTPASVVQCAGGEQLTDSEGVWAAVTVRQLEGDLGPLLEALGRASEPAGADPTCAEPQSPAGELWLVDALGRAVLAAQPVDSCGRPLAEVRAAVEGLDATAEEHFPVDLLAARVTASPTP